MMYEKLIIVQFVLEKYLELKKHVRAYPIMSDNYWNFMMKLLQMIYRTVKKLNQILAFVESQ